MTRKIYLPRVSGPFRAYARGYYDYAQALGYTAQSAGWPVWVLARLSQWLESTGIAPQSLTEKDLQAFVVGSRRSPLDASLPPRRPHPERKSAGADRPARSEARALSPRRLALGLPGKSVIMPTCLSLGARPPPPAMDRSA